VGFEPALSRSRRSLHSPRPAEASLVPIGQEPLLPTGRSHTENHNMMKVHRTESQAASSRSNGSRSRGPRTSEGKTRSSMNRVAHGLNSHHTLIPGESLEEYEAFIASWFSSLKASNSAEAKIISFIADQAWKLSRLNRIENGQYLESLEEALEETESFKSFSKTETALTVVTALLQNLDGVVELNATSNSTKFFVSGLGGTLTILEDAPHLSLAVIAPLTRAATQIIKDDEANPEAVKELRVAAQHAVDGLKTELAKNEIEVEKTRELLAEQLLPLQETDVKLIDRYRRCPEVSMQRQMLLLNTTKQASTGIFTIDNEVRPFPVSVKVVQ
jgi:hypothetical protein